MDGKRIVAIALLTERDLKKLGPTFARAYPVEDTPAFDALLAAIDEADCALSEFQHTAALFTDRSP